VGTSTISQIPSTAARPVKIRWLAGRAGALMQEMVEQAGIEIGRDLIVNDRSMWGDWATRGMLGIGESYMQGKWDSPHVDLVMSRLASLPSDVKTRLFNSWRNKAILAFAALSNAQKPSKELEVARGHYNLGNDFFASWLEPEMQYSCAAWKDVETLEEAQKAKMRLIAEKLCICRGMRVLDIGCGWGGLGRFLAREYGAKVTGVNISSEQVKCCREKSASEGCIDDFDILETSYRNLSGRWDRIVCIGMIEHVGPKNYREFFEICHRSLADGGLMLLQTIGSNTSKDILNDRWITAYIFPNGTLPSIAQIARAVEKKLVIEDLHNLGPDYDRTLMCWHENFQKVKPSMNLDPRFERMWDFFLLYTASGFRERKTQLWQFVMSKHRKARYDAPRN
jgi:cyclopropane-fatty-acyl-phospholipid synthase